MTHTTISNGEPAWAWIIGLGLAGMIAVGLMLQMQFGGVHPDAGFETSSRYETLKSAGPTTKPSDSPASATVTAGVPPAGPTINLLQHYSPPANQPDWLQVPCTATRAAEIQRAWAEHLRLPVEIKNRLGQTFRLIPPGIYDRGAQLPAMESLLGSMPAEDTHWRDCLLSSTPAHRVVISRPFYLAVHETTQAEYAAIVGMNPAWYSAGGPEPHYVEQVAGEDTARHPVEGVSWTAAREFMRLLSRHELGRFDNLPQFNQRQPSAEVAPPQLGESSTDGALTAILTPAGAVLADAAVSLYRLPTDAEWEHACRGGAASPFSFGEQESRPEGWFGAANGGRTWQIGRGKANPLGLHGVHEGVWEWVEDQWSVGEYGGYRRWPVENPLVNSSSPLPRVVRGGMWPDRRSRSFDRYAYDPEFQTFFVGFRLALSLPEAAN